MDRRGFFKTPVKKVTDKRPEVRSFDSGLNAYSGVWTQREVKHLLKRTMFGATKADIDHFITMSTSDCVDALLNSVETSFDPPVRDYAYVEDQGVQYDDPGVVLGATWINDYNTTATDPGVRSAINRKRIDGLRKWWSGKIINQQRSIQEKMVLFWHHHFSVQMEEVDNAANLYSHHALLRNNVLGNIKNLTKLVTVDPAMLMHLNGALNSKLAPDENYARELQELFTVGKGPGSQYTEADVRAAAQVLTGWRINYNTNSSYFDPNQHDLSTKTFSAFYQNTTIAGNSTGMQEINQLIEMIYSTQESARYFCRKLYKWFVYYDIDSSVEQTVIVPMANLLIASNFEVKPVLSALFKSDHFFDVKNQACQIKSPFDLMVGTLRELGTTFPPTSDYAAGYPLFFSIYQTAASMQQDLFQPPDVSGWAAYYQEPVYYELWINSNSLPKRADFTNSVVTDHVGDVLAYVNQVSTPSDPDMLINTIVEQQFSYPLSANSKQYVKNKFLLNETGNNSQWTNTWNSNDSAVINTSLQQLFIFLMNLPEYHLC